MDTPDFEPPPDRSVHGRNVATGKAFCLICPKRSKNEDNDQFRSEFV